MPPMFGRKRAKDAPQQQPASLQSQSYSSGGYVVTELPTYTAGKRKVVVYTSDASGKIIKTFKR